MTTMPKYLPADVPFTLACATCDVESPETYAEALQQGWTRIQYDDGLSWYFLGICPDCRPGGRHVALSAVSPCFDVL